MSVIVNRLDDTLNIAISSENNAPIPDESLFNDSKSTDVIIACLMYNNKSFFTNNVPTKIVVNHNRGNQISSYDYNQEILKNLVLDFENSSLLEDYTYCLKTLSYQDLQSLESCIRLINNYKESYDFENGDIGTYNFVGEFWNILSMYSSFCGFYNNVNMAEVKDFIQMMQLAGRIDDNYISKDLAPKLHPLLVKCEINLSVLEMNGHELHEYLTKKVDNR